MIVTNLAGFPIRDTFINSTYCYRTSERTFPSSQTTLLIASPFSLSSWLITSFSPTIPSTLGEFLHLSCQRHLLHHLPMEEPDTFCVFSFFKLFD